MATAGRVHFKAMADPFSIASSSSGFQSTLAELPQSVPPSPSTYTGRGGAVFGSFTSLTITNSTFSSNFAGDGGALYVQTPTAPFSASLCTFTENRASHKLFQAASHGGAVYITEVSSDAAPSSFLSSSFIANQADFGGAVYASTATRTQFTSSNFFSNTAPQGGGALNSANGDVRLMGHNTFSNNAALEGGGGALLISSRELANIDQTSVVATADNVAAYGSTIASPPTQLKLFNSSGRSLVPLPADSIIRTKSGSTFGFAVTLQLVDAFGQLVVSESFSSAQAVLSAGGGYFGNPQALFNNGSALFDSYGVIAVPVRCEQSSHSNRYDSCCQYCPSSLLTVFYYYYYYYFLSSRATPFF